MKQPKKLCVLITGAAAGIGKAVAQLFLKNGHTVYALDVRLPEVGIPLQGDITNDKQIKELFDGLAKENVRLDAIFHFAGVHTIGSFLETQYETLKRLTEIDY